MGARLIWQNTTCQFENIYTCAVHKTNGSCRKFCLKICIANFVMTFSHFLVKFHSSSTFLKHFAQKLDTFHTKCTLLRQFPYFEHIWYVQNIHMTLHEHTLFWTFFIRVFQVICQKTTCNFHNIYTCAVQNAYEWRRKFCLQKCIADFAMTFSHFFVKFHTLSTFLTDIAQKLNTMHIPSFFKIQYEQSLDKSHICKENCFFLHTLDTSFLLSLTRAFLDFHFTFDTFFLATRSRANVLHLFVRFGDGPFKVSRCSH